MRIGKYRFRITRKAIYGVAVIGLLLLGIWGTSGDRQGEFPGDQDGPPKSSSPAIDQSHEWQRSLAPFPEIKMVSHSETVSGVKVNEQVRRPVIASAAVMRSFERMSRPSETNGVDLETSFVSPIRVEPSQEEWFAWQGPVAPVGRLLRVELLNAIDSSIRRNPVMGLVTHDLYWNGELLIPAGTEVHGMATTELARESLITGNEWQLVFVGNRGGIPNGWVLPVVATALERQDKTGEGKSFGMSDMRLGLPGVRMQAEEYLQIKLFLSNFLGAAVSSLQSRRVNIFSGTSIVEETARNATLAGLADVLREFSQGVLKEIERIGFYLRIRAGTQFYLMIQEPLDLNRGKLGGERIIEMPGIPVSATGTGPLPDLRRLQDIEEQLGFVWEDLWKKSLAK